MSQRPDQLPVSYWHATFPPPVPEESLPAGTDVAVIGGGMLGVWTAYWLARQGVDVTLIEREVISWGATGRNGGFLTGGGALSYRSAIDSFGRDAARAIWTVSADGRALAQDVIGREEIDCDFRMPGIMSLALFEADLDRKRSNVALLHEDGFTAELLDREDVQDVVRTPLGEEIAGGVLAPDGGLLHSGRYLAGLAAAAKRHGARICQADVTGITSTESGATVSTASGDVEAQRVVIAVNAWTDTLVPGLAGRIVPVRGQILAYEPVEPVFETGVGTDITPTGEYWQQATDGSIVIGGCRADAPNGDVDVREMRPTPDVTAKIEGVIPRLFPDLAGLRVARRWAGLMAFTSDYVPVADAAPEMPNVWVGGGFCGHGMPFGPRIGQLLADAAMSGQTPEALHPFRANRESLTLLSASDTRQETDVIPQAE